MALEPSKDPGNMEAILSGMDDLRKNEELFDVLLCAEGEELPCHKAVLASCSDYFKAMFTNAMAEKEQRRVPVNGVTASDLRMTLDFVYTSTISITDTNVETLMSAANYLQVTRLKDACCRFLENRLDETNCLRVYQLADRCACADLEAKAKRYACDHFEKVTSHEDFLELPKGKLVELISEDRLNVQKEELLFKAILTWLRHSPETRKEGFEDIFRQVRLPLMNPYYLALGVGETPEVLRNETCCKLLEEAKMFHLLPDRRRECSRPWTTPRWNSSMLEAAVLVGGHDGREPVRNVDCYIPSRGKWLDLTQLFQGVYKHGVTASGQNSMFFVGGEHNPAGCNAPALIFNPALNSYCRAAAMTCMRRHVSLASVDGFVYAVGATNDEPDVPSVERYREASNQWEPVKAMDTKLATPAVAASLQGKLFVAGVTDTAGDERVGCIQCFDPDSERWETLSSSLPPLSYSSPCVFNGKLYLVGGWDSLEEESSKSVICFDPTTSTWNICEPMKEGRASPGVAVMENKIFVFGGSPNVHDKRQAIDTIETYDSGTNKWRSTGKMRVKRSWFGCTTLNIPYSVADRRRASK